MSISTLIFINVGPRLAAQISDHRNLNPTQYITRSFGNSFMFRAINVQEVKDRIQNLKINKASIGIPNKCIKLAANHIGEALKCPCDQKNHFLFFFRL